MLGQAGAGAGAVLERSAAGAGITSATTVATLVEAIGLGFQRGTHTNWQLVRNDATGAPTLVDLGAGFGRN